MTQPSGSGAPTPVSGVTGGPGLPQGAASVDGTTGNIVLTPPGNTVQIKKTATPQSLQIYEFAVGDTDYSRLQLSAAVGGPFTIQTEGPTTQRNLVISSARALILIGQSNNPMEFWTSNVHRWDIESTVGHLVPFTNGLIQVGTATSQLLTVISRSFSLYSGTGVIASSLLSGTGVPAVGLGVNGDIYFNVGGGALTTMYQKRAGAWVGIV